MGFRAGPPPRFVSGFRWGHQDFGAPFVVPLLAGVARELGFDVRHLVVDTLRSASGGAHTGRQQMTRSANARISSSRTRRTRVRVQGLIAHILEFVKRISDWAGVPVLTAQELLLEAVVEISHVLAIIHRGVEAQRAHVLHERHDLLALLLAEVRARERVVP